MSGHTEPAVMFDQVFKAFGPNHVLRNVSFSVPAGNALCILGRSGTGKSVTLKLLMALIKPDQGSIWVDGDDITRLTPAGVSKVRRKMGFRLPERRSHLAASRPVVPLELEGC